MKSLKRSVAFFTVLFVFSALLLLPASADLGPKPSVRISFPSTSRSFYVTLLSDTAETGPYSYQSLSYEREQLESNEELNAFDRFASYLDEDGFWFLGYMSKCDSANDFAWTYYPPNTFKVLVYFPDTDKFVVSTAYTRYAFESIYKASFAVNEVQLGSDDNDETVIIDVQKNRLNAIIGMLCRLALTLVIELVIAVPFGLFKKGPRKIVILTNIITQVLLNVSLFLTDCYYGLLVTMMLYVFAEISIFFIEAIVYSITITPLTPPSGKKPYRWWMLWLYSFAANAVSFVTGLMLR